MNRINRLQVTAYLKDAAGIAFGCMFCGFAFSMFLIPFKSSPGGLGGLSQILFHLFNVPAGLAMFAFNIPLLILGMVMLGRSFASKTVLGMVFMSVFTEVFSSRVMVNIPFLEPMLYRITETSWSFTNEYFLGVVAGSVFLGIGIGIVFRFNGSTGGTDIPALIFKKKFGISPGTSFLILDTFIILLVGAVFRNGNLIFWGFISLFISSKVCDSLIEGLPYYRGVFVITSEDRRVKQYVLDDLERGCTIFKGEGGYSGDDKNIIYTVVSLPELARMKHDIRDIDKGAFVIVNEVYDVLGNGFKKFG